MCVECTLASVAVSLISDPSVRLAAQTVGDKLICKIIGHRDREDFDMSRKPSLMWRCIRCGRREEMLFTCLIVRPALNK